MEKKNIIAISGSTSDSSTNLHLIKAIANLAIDKLQVTIFEGLTEIPHYNPDLDTANPPPQVTAFREKLRASDGILICTPEYAMGIPGTLKNAIDWTVSSMEFSQKPVALITASFMGQKGHQALLETLNVIEAAMTRETQLLISFAKTKISSDSIITDQKTLSAIKALIHSFYQLLTRITSVNDNARS